MTGSERETSTERDLSGPARLALKLGERRALLGVYRATGGKLFGRMGKSPILLLNTTGGKSGKRRTSPLLYVMDGEDFVIIASKGGAPTHPAWYLNLKADPDASVEVGDREVRVRAEEADPEEKSASGRRWSRCIRPTTTTRGRRSGRSHSLILHPVEGGGAS